MGLTGEAQASWEKQVASFEEHVMAQRERALSMMKSISTRMDELVTLAEGVAPLAAAHRRLENANDGSAVGNVAATLEDRLVNAQQAFNAASSFGQSASERALERELATAVVSPSHLRKSNRRLQHSPGSICAPDFRACPKTWAQRGTVCSAPVEYSGPCASELNMSGMVPDQKMALARYCKLSFPCL